MNAPKIEYKEHAVAFLDVMGFKNLLKDPGKLQQYYDRVIRHLKEKEDAFKKWHPQTELKKLLVSDSIILAIPIYDLDSGEKIKVLANFFSSIGFTQHILAKELDIWVRGAISIGDFYLNESQNIMVGEGFVKAYELEAQADYPRVILDPKICRIVSMDIPTFIKAINKECENKYPGNLLDEPKPDLQLRPAFTLDALQINWFAHTVAEKANMDNFFKGVTARMSENQNLFGKSRRLMKYIRAALEESIYTGVIKDRQNSLYRQYSKYLDHSGF